MPSDPSHFICTGLLSLTLFKQHLVFVTNQNKQPALPMRKGNKVGAGGTVKETFLEVGGVKNYLYHLKYPH